MNLKEKNKLEIEYAGLSDVGIVRSENQDSFGKFPEDSNNIYQPKGILFIIADGMGGHEGGKDASRIAVETVSEKYFSCSSHKISNCLKTAIEEANSNIYNRSEGKLQLRRMGTTCTSLVINKELAFIGHVGDSRIYKINKESIKQLTDDHTEVEEMFRKGILSKEEVKTHPNKSILVRALGIEHQIEIDIKDNISIGYGDYFVICSDGLSKVTMEELKKIVLFNSPKDACGKLVNLANKRGGTDNVTVQIIRINQQNIASSFPPTQLERKISKKVLGIGLIAVIILLAAIIYFILSPKPATEKESPEFIQKNEVKLEKGSGGTNTNTVSYIEKLFIYAEEKYEKNNFDEALIYYQKILESKPLHLGALDGVYKITNQYVKQANTFQKENNFQKAIFSFNKAIKLKPNDKQILSKIKFCENEIKNLDFEKDSFSISPSNDNIVSDKLKIKSVKKNNIDKNFTSKGNASNWITNGLSEEDFQLGINEVTLSPTLRTKKVLSNKSYNDVDFEVYINQQKNQKEGEVGLIVGYSIAKGTDTETYFLISIEQNGSLKLHKFSGSSKKQLFSIQLELTKNTDLIIYELKLKCLGPWIMIYNNQKLLKAWYHKKLVRGKIGLFADENTYARFTEIKISEPIYPGNKNKQFQSKVNL